jgi:allantoinase
MQNTDAILRSRRIVTPQGVTDGAVVIRDGRIDAVCPPEAIPDGAPVKDYGDLVLMPGLVDTHVHINEPGRTDWEGFVTATRAAAAGGLTTLVDMPLNSSPVTTSPAALQAKRDTAQGQCWIDVGFHGGLVGGNASEMGLLIAAGVLAMKAFLVDSGIDEFPPAQEADLRTAMPILAAHGIPLLVHAELAGPMPPGPAVLHRYADYLASRPRDWEHRAIRQMIALCREYRCPVHIVHLSSADMLPELAAARAEGLPLTVETCPHYLVFDAETIPDGDTRFKCAPPIREHENRERLWQGLRDGTIDTIASDHSPCPPELKRADAADFAVAWGGIASLQLGLPVVWTEARLRGFSLPDVAEWMSRRPAALVGLTGVKGTLQPGADADIVVWDPESSWTVTASDLHHRHKITPYDGMTLHGTVHTTYLRGAKVFDNGEIVGDSSGRLLMPL